MGENQSRVSLKDDNSIHSPKAIVIIPMTTFRAAIILKAVIVQFLEFGHTLTDRRTTQHTDTH